MTVPTVIGILKPFSRKTRHSPVLIQCFQGWYTAGRYVVSDYRLCAAVVIQDTWKKGSRQIKCNFYMVQRKETATMVSLSLSPNDS